MNDIIYKRQSWTSDKGVGRARGGCGGARPELSLIVSGEGWADTQLCWRAAPDNQKPSWAPEKMERKATGGKERAFVCAQKRLVSASRAQIRGKLA